MLYDRHVAAIYRFTRSRLPDAASAEDVTSAVFLKALRGIGTYRDYGLPFSGWLYQIARNEVADHFRHQFPSLQLGDSVSGRAGSVEDHAIQTDELRRAWRLIDGLPAQQRTAMVLKFRDDRSPREVGAMMGKSEGAAKLLIYRAVQRLRSQLAGPQEGERGRPALARS